ncbi:MAG: hypothetical protein C4329_06650 [Chitinophagaceae bacterium]
MKNVTLPKKKETNPLTLVTSQYNHLFVVAKKGQHKKEFIYHSLLQVHPAVHLLSTWDEHWFGNYE